MTNELILIKLSQRLDKLSSGDYGNIEDWMYIEAFNKEYSDWIRRQIEGANQEKVTIEGTLKRIDDLQFLLTDPTPLTLTAENILYSAPIPDNYLGWCRISAFGKDECCPARKFIVFIDREADIDINLQDSGKQPSFQWATTRATLSNNKIKIYTNGEFIITDADLTYYRIPLFIEMISVANPFTGVVSTVDVLCEAPDNVIEVIIEGASAILARDIKSYQEAQMNTAAADRNT